jgi:hypothetical protein
METIPYKYETKRLDHLGIVAGICKQIDLVNIIDESLPTPSDRKVSCGQATLGDVFPLIHFPVFQLALPFTWEEQRVIRLYEIAK